MRPSCYSTHIGVCASEETPFRVGQIIIHGNTVRQDRVIRRELPFYTGKTFGSGLVDHRTPAMPALLELADPMPMSLAFDAPPAGSDIEFKIRHFDLQEPVDGGEEKFNYTRMQEWHESSVDGAVVNRPLFIGSSRTLSGRLPTNGGRLGDFRRPVDEWGEGRALGDQTLAYRGVLIANDPKPQSAGVPDSAILGGTEEEAARKDRESQQLGYMALASQAPQYYSRPSFSGDQRVFTDLVAYCPGMSSSPADVRMVLEQEAAPRFGQRLGHIDPAARKLIESARSTEWKLLKLPGGVEFVHDGSGRYAYERTLSFGLKERVICDGKHLWHLYPELGIGAKRTVSRFHRAFLYDLIPDFLPPADDLAHGADVKAIDAKTVALVAAHAAEGPGAADRLAGSAARFRWQAPGRTAMGIGAKEQAE